MAAGLDCAGTNCHNVGGNVRRQEIIQHDVIMWIVFVYVKNKSGHVALR